MVDGLFVGYLPGRPRYPSQCEATGLNELEKPVEWQRSPRSRGSGPEGGVACGVSRSPGPV